MIFIEALIDEKMDRFRKGYALRRDLNGHVIKRSNGKANPQLVNEMLKKALS